MAASVLAGQRDLRIDFFRGVALYTILVDHIAFNPLARFTYHRFGFSDMAEAFVFLSGISCALFYSGLLGRDGCRALVAALTKRAVLMYVFYLGSSVATIALIWTMRGPLGDAGAVDPQWASYTVSPAVAIARAILLIDQPGFPSILILYVELTLVAIPLFLLVSRNSLASAVAVSGAIWLVTQLSIFGLDRPNRLFPYFNPLAWQFLFCIGMACGIRIRNAPTSMPRRHILLSLAWCIVMLSLIWKLYPAAAARMGLPLEWHRLLSASESLHKYNLSIERLLHFMSVAALIGAHIGPQARCLWSPYDCMIKTGRWSLEAFSLGTVLSVLGTVVFLITSPSMLEKIAFDAAAILTTALLAIGLSARAGSRWGTAQRSRRQ